MVDKNYSMRSSKHGRDSFPTHFSIFTFLYTLDGFRRLQFIRLAADLALEYYVESMVDPL